MKPPYRSTGVLKRLAEYVIKEHNVKMMYIETSRLVNNFDYYQKLGFKNYYTVKNGLLSWAFQDDIWPYVIEKNKRTT